MRVISVTFAAILMLTNAYAGDNVDAVSIHTSVMRHFSDGTTSIEQNDQHFGLQGVDKSSISGNVSLGVFDTLKSGLEKAGQKVVAAGTSALDLAQKGAHKAGEIAKTVGGVALKGVTAVAGAAGQFVVDNQDTLKEIASTAAQGAVKVGAGVAVAGMTGGKAGAKAHVKEQLTNLAGGGKKEDKKETNEE